jgi:hypothetical protein
MRSPTEGWCGPLVARGVTATVGNVFEPYLEYLHRPDMLAAALVRGDDLVDAAYFALPVLSWQAVVIGDPLYHPFAASLDQQMAGLSSLPPQLAGYAVIRRMNQLDAAGRQAEAIEAGRAAMKTVPNLALALALARRLDAEGNGDEPAWLVKAAAETADLSPGNWALMNEAASFLAGHRRAGEAIELYQRLFLVDAIPPAVRYPWLVEARRVALASGDTAQAAEWNGEILQSPEHPLGDAP